MPKLFIPVGIPGCGKTTFVARILMHNNLKVVETDDIRAEMVGEDLLQSVSDMSRNDEVFRRFHQRIEDHLLDGFDVYADSTALRDFARAKFRDIAERVGAETHLLVFTNLTSAVNRNAKRQRVVPGDVMVSMIGQYEKALRDIPQESYTTITYIESIS